MFKGIAQRLPHAIGNSSRLSWALGVAVTQDTSTLGRSSEIQFCVPQDVPGRGESLASPTVLLFRTDPSPLNFPNERGKFNLHEKVRYGEVGIGNNSWEIPSKTRLYILLEGAWIGSTFWEGNCVTLNCKVWILSHYFLLKTVSE